MEEVAGVLAVHRACFFPRCRPQPGAAREAGATGHIFIQVLPCCAKEHFKQTPVEFLPMALPKESQDMVRLMRVMLDAWASHDHPSETWLEIVEQADRRKRKPGHGCRWLC